MATEAHVTEQRRLRESLAALEARYKRSDRERHELFHTQASQRANAKGLEDQLDDLRDELRKTKQELSEQRSQYFQLR